MIPGSSWVNNVTRGPDAITVAGTALDVNGWGASGQSIDATGMAFVTIFAKVEGHVTFKKGLKGRTFISVLPAKVAAE